MARNNFLLAVQGEAHTAVGAAPDLAAKEALQKIGEAAPIEKDQSLAFGREVLPQKLDERVRKRRGLEFFLSRITGALLRFDGRKARVILAAQIDGFDDRQRPLLDSLGNFQQPITPLAAILVAFQRRSG